MIAEMVEDVLNNTGWPWKKREVGWVINPRVKGAGEILLSLGDNEVSLVAILATWETLDEGARQAIEVFVTRANEELGDGFCQMAALEVRLEMGVASERIETELSSALASAAAGSALLVRPLQALVNAPLAAKYRHFHGLPDPAPRGSLIAQGAQSEGE